MARPIVTTMSAWMAGSTTVVAVTPSAVRTASAPEKASVRPARSASEVTTATREPGGTFAMYNYYEQFLLNRYAHTLDDVGKRCPQAFRVDRNIHTARLNG